MRISNVEVYGLQQSLIRAGYPLQVDIDHDMESWKVSDGITDVMLKRGVKLGTTKSGEGHDKFLRGIVVQFDLTAPRYFYQEWDTYHFAENLSSQSTMHRMVKFDVASMCNKFVDPIVIINLEKLIKKYIENPTEENFLKVKSNVPEGLELTRGVSTNYAELKTMYNQRCNHKLPEWRNVFCPWVLELPYFKQFCVKVNN